jgi:hypothetical protein
MMRKHNYRVIFLPCFRQGIMFTVYYLLTGITVNRGKTGADFFFINKILRLCTPHCRFLIPYYCKIQKAEGYLPINEKIGNPC